MRPIIKHPRTGEPLLSTAEVARRLGVSTRTVQRYVRRGDLTAHRLTPRSPLRIPESALPSDYEESAVADTTTLREAERATAAETFDPAGAARLLRALGGAA